MDSISTIAEISVAIGTFALALATYGSVMETQKQVKRDRISREIDYLIIPLKTAYQEIDSRGINGNWWELYLGPIRTKTDPVATEKFRDSVDSIDQYRYLAPENLRLLIDEFLLRLNDMRREEDALNLGDLQKSLVTSAKNLYYGNNMRGGPVEVRYYELSKEMEGLNKDLISRLRDGWPK